MVDLDGRVAPGETLSDCDALELADVEGRRLDELLEAAAAVRDRAWGRRVTFSPKVFLPLTNLCGNHCDYCSFRRSPRQAGAWTMSPAEVREWLDRAHEQGCSEALFCLGDKPERSFPSYRAELAALGFDGTVDYLCFASRLALERDLLPHTNAGVLSEDDMRRLRPVNVSLGLMLENVSERLCEPGMPHHRAPDKRPELRIAMIDAAGRLRIPFTTGVLVGIGETRRERVESLLAIRELYRRYGHVQEVIVQNFTPRPQVRMKGVAEPVDAEMARTVALARMILDADVSVQAPPNLNPHRTSLLLDAGINDFGGISPVSPDYISPRHPWPRLDELGDACAARGFELGPRVAVYDSFLKKDGFVDPMLVPTVQRERQRLRTAGDAATLVRRKGERWPALGARPA